MLTNASGEAAGKFSYGPYGVLEASSGTQTTPLGYAGQYTLAQSGLQYLRARVYDPVTGQFLMRDPAEAITRQPYAYVFDNPLNGADPNGRIAGAAAGCVVGELVEPAGGCAPGAAPTGGAALAGAAAGALAGSLTGNEEIAGTLTISKGVAARLAESNNPSELDREEPCDGKELKREGEELLGRGHSQSGEERWKQWWDSLGRTERNAYKRVRGPDLVAEIRSR